MRADRGVVHLLMIRERQGDRNRDRGRNSEQELDVILHRGRSIGGLTGEGRGTKRGRSDGLYEGGGRRETSA